jgi:hypothetical protein
MIALLASLAFAAADTGGLDHRPDIGPALPLTTVLALPERRLDLGIGAADTVRRRPRAKAVEYSDAYNTRRRIHKAASYATIPLFVGQFLLGNTLIEQGTDSPDWVKRTHPVFATGVLALFTVNSVTGLWNAYEGLGDPNGWKWRTAHELLMLAADAGFVHVGQLSLKAKQSGAVRREHRGWAVGSSAVALTAYVMMLKPFRPD